NANRAYAARLKAFPHVHPDDREAESASLDTWSRALQAEEARIFNEALDLHQRQVARGQLAPRADGTFDVREWEPPQTPGEIALGVAKSVPASVWMWGAG